MLTGKLGMNWWMMLLFGLVLYRIVMVNSCETCESRYFLQHSLPPEFPSIRLPPASIKLCLLYWGNRQYLVFKISILIQLPWWKFYSISKRHHGGHLSTCLCRLLKNILFKHFHDFPEKKTSSSVTAFFISTADMLGLRKLLMSYYTAKHFVLCAMKAKMYFLA